MRTVNRLFFAALLGVLGLTGVSVATAQDATPVASPVAAPANCTPVATGLINPRYVAVGDDGTIYVTEAGNGGDEELPAIEGAPPLGTRGQSGQVTMIAPDGTQSVLAGGFASYQEGVGPAGIVVTTDAVWIAVGGAAVSINLEPLQYENSIVKIDRTTGEITVVAELGSYERDNNPDGTDVNPNLYGMDLGADGMLYVADAGGNTVYMVDPATGEFSLVGVVPSPVMAPQTMPDGGATPMADPAASPIADEEVGGGPIQPVPTGLHAGSDGNIHVVTLGALVPGASQVLTLQSDGTFTTSVAGLSVGIGIAMGPDGAVYVSQLASFTSETDPPGPGSVVRIGTDGTIETVIDGVPFPHGMAFDDEGNLYLIANSTVFGPPPASPIGEVWRCDGVAAGM